MNHLLSALEQDRIRPFLHELARHASSMVDSSAGLVAAKIDGETRLLGTHNLSPTEFSTWARASERVFEDGAVVDRQGADSFAAVPITLQRDVIGVVGVVHHNATSIDHGSLDLLASVARLVAAHLGSTVTTEQMLHEQALDAVGQSVVVTDLNDRVIWANGASRQLFPRQKLEGELIDDVVADAAETARARHITERIAPLVDQVRGEVAGTIRFYADTTTHEKERLRLEHLVNTEWLTGVANRRSFESRLQHEIDLFDNGIPSGQVAVGILDLDRFKAVNDILGHAVGDAVLVEVADCIKNSVEGLGFVARLGGDEFAILVYDTTIEEANRLGRAVLADIRRSMQTNDDVRRNLAASIGFTTVRAFDRDPGDVLRRADVACYAAKQAGGNRSRSDRDLRDR